MTRKCACKFSDLNPTNEMTLINLDEPNAPQLIVDTIAAYSERKDTEVRIARVGQTLNIMPEKIIRMNFFYSAKVTTGGYGLGYKYGNFHDN